MEDISDAIKSGIQEPINTATITATTIVPTMTTVTTGNGTDVTQIATQFVDESDQHINTHDTFTTLEKASYEPTVPEQDNEYNENDSLEPSPKEFEHMVELHPYNLEQFIETNSDETVDEIRRKITPETNLAEEVSKKSADEERAVEESESKEEVEAAQVEHEQTQVEEKMEIVDEEVPQVQCNDEVANQNLVEPKNESELFQEDIKLTSETDIDVQEQTKAEEEKVDRIETAQDGDNKEATSQSAMQLDQSKEEEQEPEAIAEKETDMVNEEKLHEPELISAVLAATDADFEPKPNDSAVVNNESEPLKTSSKPMSKLEDQKPEPELETEPEGEPKCELELEALPESNSKSDAETKSKPQLEVEKPAREPESKSDTEQEPETQLDLTTRFEPRPKREFRSRRGAERKSQSKPIPKPEPKLKPKQDLEEEEEEGEKEEKEDEEKDEVEQKLDDGNESKLDEIGAEPVEEITPRSTRPRRQTKTLPPPSPKQLKAEPEPKRPSKRSLVKEFVEEEKSLEPVEKTIKPARATSSRVSTTNTSTPVSHKIATTASSRPMAMASQRRGKANSYGEDGIKKFICHDCDYSTDRLNNIVYHKKSGCKAFQSYWNQSVESYKKDLIKSPKSNRKRFTR